MSRRKLPNKTKHLESVKFCSECDDLDDFTLSEKAGDGVSAKKQFDNCKKTGRFKGDMCSRVFISDYDEERFLETPDDPLENED